MGQELAGYYEELADVSLQADPLLGGGKRPHASAGYFDATRPDFVPIYQRLAAQPSVPAGEVLASDLVFQRGSGEGWASDGDV